MVRTISTSDLNDASALQVVREAIETPMIVRDGDRPVALIVSMDRLSAIGRSREGNADDWERALDAIALELYRDGTLSLEQAARFAGVSLHDFIDLCGAAGIPVLWTTPEELAADVEVWERALSPVAAPV